MNVSGERPCRVLLVGLMGSGKTTVGQLLAARTGWPYHDNDELVQQATGMTARQVLATAGELALRAAESEALEVGLAKPPPCVVGVAAGTVLTPANRRRMIDDGYVVWLTADPATLAERAAGAVHRPWLLEDAAGWLRQTAEEREPLYREVARLLVDTEDRTPEEVAEAIVEALAETAACGGWLAAAAKAALEGRPGASGTPG